MRYSGITHSAAVTVGGRNADYLIEVQVMCPDKPQWIAAGGRTGGSEAMNMISDRVSLSTRMDGLSRFPD